MSERGGDTYTEEDSVKRCWALTLWSSPQKKGKRKPWQFFINQLFKIIKINHSLWCIVCPSMPCRNCIIWRKRQQRWRRRRAGSGLFWKTPQQKRTLGGMKSNSYWSYVTKHFHFHDNITSINRISHCMTNDHKIQATTNVLQSPAVWEAEEVPYCWGKRHRRSHSCFNINILSFLSVPQTAQYAHVSAWEGGTGQTAARCQNRAVCWTETCTGEAGVHARSTAFRLFSLWLKTVTQKLSRRNKISS